MVTLPCWLSEQKALIITKLFLRYMIFLCTITCFINQCKFPTENLVKPTVLTLSRQTSTFNHQFHCQKFEIEKFKTQHVF